MNFSLKRAKPALVQTSEAAPARSPVRQDLADAISDARAADIVVGNCRAAVERARGLVDGATARLALAQEALGRAKQKRADLLMESMASGQAISTGDAVREARQAEQDAEDTLAIAGEVLEKANEDLGLAKAEQERAAAATRKAAARVFIDGIEEQIERVRGIVRQLKAAQETLRFMDAQRSELEFNPPRVVSTDVANDPLNELFHGGPEAGYREARHSALASMEQALADLLINPDAPLPTEVAR